MSKSYKVIDLKNFSKKYHGILTNDMEQTKQILEENKDAKVLIVVPKTKDSSGPEVPPWFKKFEEKQEKVNNTIFAWFKAFEEKEDARWAKQEEFNKFVLDQFRKHKWVK